MTSVLSRGHSYYVHVNSIPETPTYCDHCDHRPVLFPRAICFKLARTKYPSNLHAGVRG